VHFAHLDHIKTGSGVDGLSIAVRPNPVVDGNAAAFQEPANGMETKPYKVKLGYLPLGRPISRYGTYAYSHKIYTCTDA
jgi:hypothetical protein